MPATLGTRRAITVDLILFFGFALTALVMLTHTAVSANAIDRDIAGAVNPPLNTIEQATALLPALDSTGQLTGSIVDGTAPLGGDLAAIAASTGAIRASVHGIEGDVTSIQRSVTSIDGTVATIRADVGTAGGSSGLAPVIARIRAGAAQTTAKFGDVLGNAQAIKAYVGDISQSMSSVVADAGPIGASVRDIGGNLKSINGHVTNIENSTILQLSNVVQLHDILTGLGGLDLGGGLGTLIGGGR